MKTLEINAKAKKIFFVFLTVMLTLPLALQAQKIPFVQSTVVPAAEGYVRINSDRNNNNTVKIHIKNMAEIVKLDPSMKTYVVWMVTAQEETKNIGQIKSSNGLKVTFEAVTSFKPIKIFITAEVNESAEVPGNMLVLTTDNFYE